MASWWQRSPANYTAPRIDVRFLDGVYHEDNNEKLHFLKSPPLFDSENKKVLSKIVNRVIRWLTKNGYIDEEVASESPLSEIHAVSVQYRIGSNKVSIRFKKPWSSGATHVIYTEEKFVEKLVSLIPPRRANLFRYHGVFAPNVRLRAKICPNQKSKDEKPRRSDHIPWAELLKRTFGIDPERCDRCGGKLP